MKCICPKCNYKFLTKGNDLKLLEVLKKEGTLKISNIAKKLELSRPSVYHHLNNLEKRKLIKLFKREDLKGKPVFIRLADLSKNLK